MNIVQDPHPALRKKTTNIPEEDIVGKDVRKLIKTLKEALDSQPDGVAIAAPQLGAPVRLFLVSRRVTGLPPEHEGVFINPQIVRLGKERRWQPEGCLSVRWKYGQVKRSTSVSVKAYNSAGHEFVMRGRGLLAQIFQHEIDHLDGILFTDKAKNITNIPPEHVHI